jgi:hypothetical protein
MKVNSTFPPVKFLYVLPSWGDRCLAINLLQSINALASLKLLFQLLL